MRKVYCDIRRCLACRTCEIACVVRHAGQSDLYVTLREKPVRRPLVKIRPAEPGPFPLRCHHCEQAACIDACKSGATHRDPVSGRVLIDEAKCVGCWMCVMVCPFGAVFPDERRGKAIKCDLCHGHEQPACALACPTKALTYDEFTVFAEQYGRGGLAVPATH